MTAAATQVESAAEEAESGPPATAKLKFATRTALSLTLAYLIPMALGWPQPQTAAITVMLIAATGSLSESLQKGALRTLGTVAGAAIGLYLIALFPQERMLYLIAVSIVVTILLYLYNAYQGDSTVFMLTMVVTLMVFNGGNAEGAFLYGVDRTLLTVFGVLIYSLVGSFLWPVKISNNLCQLAAAVSAAFSQSASVLRQAIDADERKERETEALENVVHSLEAFRTHFVAVKNDAQGVQGYQDEWHTIFNCYQRLESLVIPALRSTGTAGPEFERYISNYSEVATNVEALLTALQHSWTQEQPPVLPSSIVIAYDSELLQKQKHLTIAAVISRGELLHKLQELLQQLLGAVGSLRFDQGDFKRDQETHSTPTFIWLDRENLKTAIRGFLTFWIACFIWIQYNPPGGFMFVTFCTILVPLISYTPVTPKALIFLFTFGFLFAVPAYIFLLPGMTHWLQLAAFLFSYAFLGFFLFPGPVAIFFLLGLFTLGIQNTMNYNMNVLLLVILMLYMVCAVLIISVHFPFTSKPHLLYRDFRRRFFNLCGKILSSGPPKSAVQRALNTVRLSSASALLGKMALWGSKIDSSYFPGSSAQDISAFHHSCENLLGRLKALTHPQNPYADNPVIQAARHDRGVRTSNGIAADLCATLARVDEPAIVEQQFEAVRDELSDIELKLNDYLDRSDDVIEPEGATLADQRHDRAEFYIFINLQASILVSLERCRESMLALNWQQLRDTRF